MENKIVSVKDGKVIVDSVEKTAETEVINPKTGDVRKYEQEIMEMTEPKIIATGKYKTVYQVWNGVGWATISSENEKVSFS